MKALAITLMGLSLFSTSVFASAVSDAAFDTLLSSAKTVSISGDVKEGETFNDIVKEIFNPSVSTSNECQVVGAVAKCTLYLTYSPMGETAVEYTTSASGDRLVSDLLTVSRGD